MAVRLELAPLCAGCQKRLGIIAVEQKHQTLIGLVALENRREARRMVSDYVMSEHNCRGKAIAPMPIALAAYTMDSHNCRRIVRNGTAANEGDVQVGGFPPYPISLLAILEAVDGPIRGLAPLGQDGTEMRLNNKLDAICRQSADQVRKQLDKVRISDLAAKR